MIDQRTVSPVGAVSQLSGEFDFIVSQNLEFASIFAFNMCSSLPQMALIDPAGLVAVQTATVVAQGLCGVIDLLPLPPAVVQAKKWHLPI